MCSQKDGFELILLCWEDGLPQQPKEDVKAMRIRIWKEEHEGYPTFT